MYLPLGTSILVVTHLIENSFRVRTARETMNQHLENLFGTIDVPFNDRPILEVRIPDAVPEAFEKVLNYIYTDRIDCKSDLSLPLVPSMEAI